MTAQMTSQPVPFSARLRTSFNRHALTWLSVGVFLFLYVPILLLIVYSFNANQLVGQWTGFSLRWYEQLFQNDSILNALRTSLWVAGWSTLISTILGTLTALAMERFRFFGKVSYDAILYLPIIIPDIVMALSTLLFLLSLALH